MCDSPDTAQLHPHARSIVERARTLRLETQALRQRSFWLSEESRQLCRERIPPQTVWVRSLRPQMPKSPRLAEAASICVREMTRAFQLRCELDVQVRRSAEAIAALEAMRAQAPDLADWVLPDLFPAEHAPREHEPPAPVLPQEPLALEITGQVLDRYNWEPISRFRRPRDDKTDASERRSA